MIEFIQTVSLTVIALSLVDLSLVGARIIRAIEAEGNNESK